MNRLLALLLALLPLLPIGAWGEEEDDWEDWDDWDWRAEWEENGYFDFCDVRDDTLIIFEGITAMGYARDSYWDEELEMDVEIEPRFENGPSFARDMDGGDFHRVSLPSTLRYFGMEAFCFYDFEEFTLPDQLEVLEKGAFYRCSFDMLRVETTLPATDILDCLYDCLVAAYEVPEDHPRYKSVDGVLFSKDGKTLLAYPNDRKAEHYDVPAGVERIGNGAFGNEYLKTISLPIGLKSVGDYAFSGCTRLQSIALPLTVKEIGKGIFNECVSLELVSLPEGMEAVRDENYYWAEYYPDDAIFRGDNGDTLGGERSEGSVYAPGRVRLKEEGYTTLYDSSDKKYSGKVLSGRQIVYMEATRNSLVELTEPLTGQTLGWAALEDFEYLPQETLFTYADVQPREVMNVWWNRFPKGYDSKMWIAWETKIPQADREYRASFYGPFICFQEWHSKARFGCRIQDAILTRVPDGTGNEYGIVYDEDFLKDIDMLQQPGGEKLKSLIGGTQVQILDETEAWYQVTDGRDTGWVEKVQVKIVPEE
ncbi:MAG: leucine-rich repeat protein [Clostridia bacterium]|nr:leucine-rich repeat protein [Clostridia bacterium]